MKGIIHSSLILVFVVILSLSVRCLSVNADETDTDLTINSPSCILMELNSGTILYEKDADTPRRPASVTKLMTTLLAFEALEKGKIHLEDRCTISENAASMGGSQVYLEAGEEQSFNNLLKAMIVSSANDAATAVGEVIGGSEEQFVSMMNQRAKELKMKHTHFENACGLEAEGHLMSARDIGSLSRELLRKHPKVLDYTTIWMDSIVHNTKKGESDFGLANTNKFLKKYRGANGLKTGYTSAAGYSMSATATRDNITLIAVVMGAKTKEERYADAAKLLDYGFANCTLYRDDNVLEDINELPVIDGSKKVVQIKAQKEYECTLIGKQRECNISKSLVDKEIVAPVSKGQRVGLIEYRAGDTVIGSVDLYTSENIEKRHYWGTFYQLLRQYMNTK